MKKWISLFCPLIMIFILTSFRSKQASNLEVPDTLKVNGPTEVLFPKNKTVFKQVMAVPPFLGSTYIGFKEALAFKESQGDYFTTNTLGYLGKYQFGIGTLQLMGVQEKVFHTNIARNKWILRKDIPRFVGQHMNGVEITESGILAAAHLAGAGNVKRFLRSHGDFDVNDAFGTSINSYMKKFSGYDVSHVTPKRNAKI